MPRLVKEPNIRSQKGRAKLPVRREPHFNTIQPGLGLGYRAGAGTWVARVHNEETGKRTFHALGMADTDGMEANGVDVLSHEQAVVAARQWLTTTERAAVSGREIKKTYRVKDACAAYLTAYDRRGGKDRSRIKGTIDAHILPTLGEAEVVKLTTARLEKWLDQIVNTPPRLRTRKGEEQKYKVLDTSEEGVRRRRSTANRVLTVLKAALNHAHAKEKAVPHADAWEAVKPFREADASRIRYLSDDEAKKLVNACPPDFRKLVLAGLMTGARYGEVTAWKVADFNASAGTIFIPKSKTEKARHVRLTREGVRLFTDAVLGKASDAVIFTHDDGRSWGKSHQDKPMSAAVKASKIAKVTFHELRHTYASKLVMAGVQLMVVAQQMGHSDTRMVEKHYGHLAPSYVADVVQAAMGETGLVPPDDKKVVALK